MVLIKHEFEYKVLFICKYKYCTESKGLVVDGFVKKY